MVDQPTKKSIILDSLRSLNTAPGKLDVLNKMQSNFKFIEKKKKLS